MTQRPLRERKIAIKNSLKISLTGLFLFFGLFLIFSNVFAYGLNDGFEIHELGEICGQWDWYCSATSTGCVLISTNFAYEGVQSLRTNEGTSTNHAWKYFDEPIASGTQIFWIYPHIVSADGGDIGTPNVIRFMSDLGSVWGLSVLCKDNDCEANGFYLKEAPNNYCDLPAETWTKIEVGWDNIINKYRVRCDDGSWYPEVFKTITEIIAIRIDTNGNTSVDNDDTEFYFDNFGTPSCSEYFNFYDCSLAGCYWYYASFGNFCSDIIFGGECGSDWYSCSSCETEENCEAQEDCYWFQGLCHYGTGACGLGVQLQFCETQGECEGFGGYWFENFCWGEPEPEIIIWEDYYLEHGEYATPSDWVLSLTSTTSSLFKNIGGFISGFRNFFDLQSAYQKGLELGGAIPKARGYVSLLDGFTGALPIGTLLIFAFGFLLAIGVFRIVRNLIQLLKFW